MIRLAGARARVATGTAAVALTALVAGCAGSANTTSTSASNGPIAGDLRVVTNWTGPEGAAFAQVVKGFEAKYPSVHVQTQVVPFEQGQALLTQQFAQGNPPDVAVALPGLVRAFSQDGLLTNLDSDWSHWIADGEYTQTVRDMAQGSDGHTDAVLFKGNVNNLIWYDPKELTKLGLTVPKTWSQFTAVADRAKAEGVAPFAVGGKDKWPLTQWSDGIIMRVAGVDAYNDLARGKIGWDDPRIVMSFQVLAGLIKSYFPPNALSAGFSDSTCARVAGKYLFENQGAFVNLTDAQSCGTTLTPGKDLAFFQLPQYGQTPVSSFTSGDLFVGAKASKNPAAAHALLDYLASAPAQEIWAKIGGYVAPNNDVPASVYPNSNDRAAAALWPRTASDQSGYSISDWIGGAIQVTYQQALSQFVNDGNVNEFIHAMTTVDTRSKH